MPRASTAVENQRVGGNQFAFQPGIGKITNVITINRQLGTWLVCGYDITLQRLDKNNKPTDDEEITQFHPLGNVATRDGDPLFHPGKAKGADDEDPKDMGAEEGAEGNALWAANGELKIDKSMGGAVFSASLQEHGVKASLLTGYGPNLVGLIADWKQQTLKEADKGTGKGAVTALVVNSKIIQMPNGAKAAATGSGSGGTAAKPKPKPAETETDEAEAGTGGGDVDPKVEAGAIACLTLLATAFAGQTVTRQKINTKLMTLWVKAKVKPAEQAGVQELFANDEWFKEKAGDLEWKLKGDNVTIPEAAE